MKQNETNEKSGKTPLQKDRMKIRLFFLAILVLSIVLMCISEVTLFFGIIVFPCVFLYFPTIKATKHKYCQSCGKLFDYENEISCEEESRESTSTSVRSVVHFECYCSSCGTKHEFNQKFTTASYDSKKGTWTQKSLSTLCKDYFKPFRLK